MEGNRYWHRDRLQNKPETLPRHKVPFPIINTNRAPQRTVAEPIFQYRHLCYEQIVRKFNFFKWKAVVRIKLESIDTGFTIWRHGKWTITQHTSHLTLPPRPKPADLMKLPVRAMRLRIHEIELWILRMCPLNLKFYKFNPGQLGINTDNLCPDTTSSQRSLGPELWRHHP